MCLMQILTCGPDSSVFSTLTGSSSSSSLGFQARDIPGHIWRYVTGAGSTWRFLQAEQMLSASPLPSSHTLQINSADCVNWLTAGAWEMMTREERRVVFYFIFNLLCCDNASLAVAVNSLPFGRESRMRRDPLGGRKRLRREPAFGEVAGGLCCKAGFCLRWL